MSAGRFERRLLLTLALAVALGTAGSAQQQDRPFEPQVGQPGKDVVWVPTPPEMVERMLDLAEVTAQDFVIDLGSGDGRNVIGAAKRGAQALGVEYNPDMVELSRRLAREAGVGDRAQFVQGDMFEADISKASVMALFLLPSNMLQLRNKFVALRPGTRIVSNTFGIQDWPADETVTLDNCSAWCTALLWIVPARVAGRWELPEGELMLNQNFQMLSGTIGGTPISDGRMRGDQIRFTAGATEFIGKVTDDRMEGTVRGAGNPRSWSARKVG
jgi:SAM-dependent methyltransferase